jgi:hypothetical protein
MATETDLTMQEEEEAKAGHEAVKKAGSGRHKPLRMKHKIMLIVLSLLLMGFLRTGFMFVIIGLLPSIVAYYMDITADRYTFKTIFACNLCGMLPYIGRMLHEGPSSALLQNLMGTAMNWVIIYGTAILGWLLVEICPMIAQVLIAGFSQAQITRIERLQKKIEREWGPEVTELSKEGGIDGL